MKNTINNFKEFFYIIRYYRRYLKSKSYEKKIRKGILDREAEKILVLYEAKKLIPKKIKRSISIYIPYSPATKAKIKAIILKEFGYKMKVLGMRITDDLKFI